MLETIRLMLVDDHPFVRDGVRINSARPRRSFEVEGVNSKGELAALERVLQAREAQRTGIEP